jgi:hypothetical protein
MSTAMSCHCRRQLVCEETFSATRCCFCGQSGIEQAKRDLEQTAQLNCSTHALGVGEWELDSPASGGVVVERGVEIERSLKKHLPRAGACIALCNGLYTHSTHGGCMPTHADGEPGRFTSINQSDATHQSCEHVFIGPKDWTSRRLQSDTKRSTAWS